MVKKVNELDGEINLATCSIIQGVLPPTAQEMHLLFEKIIQRTILNEELQRVCDGESLTMCTSFIILCLFARHLECNRLSGIVNENQ